MFRISFSSFPNSLTIPGGPQRHTSLPPFDDAKFLAPSSLLPVSVCQHALVVPLLFVDSVPRSLVGLDFSLVPLALADAIERFFPTGLSQFERALQ